MKTNPVSKEDIEKLFGELSAFEKRGYFLNSDKEMTNGLLEGLLTNEQRYGYQACPCRLASGQKSEDLDIICPCDYRDPDLTEFGSCYCGLYVSKEIIDGKKKVAPIPERKPSKEESIKIKKMEKEKPDKKTSHLSYPVWRCDVCGYICARDEAPEICPICGAKKDRFSRFI